MLDNNQEEYNHWSIFVFDINTNWVSLHKIDFFIKSFPRNDFTKKLTKLKCGLFPYKQWLKLKIYYFIGLAGMASLPSLSWDNYRTKTSWKRKIYSNTANNSNNNNASKTNAKYLEQC